MRSVKPIIASDPSLKSMISIHQQYCQAHTPPGSGHAVSAKTLEDGEIHYWALMEDEQVLGCAGFKMIGDGHGEIKSMHVLSEARGSGIGDELLLALLGEAKRLGVHQLSLETGKSEGFAASRRLYEKHGFEHCGPFGAYKDDPFSYCMTRKL